MGTIVFPAEDRLIQHQYCRDLIPSSCRSAEFSRFSYRCSDFPRNAKRRVSPEKKQGSAKVGRRDRSFPRKEESVSPPKITILQRPQSREAAMLDLARITGLPLSEVYIRQGLTPPEQVLRNSSRQEQNLNVNQAPVTNFVRKEQPKLNPVQKFAKKQKQVELEEQQAIPTKQEWQTVLNSFQNGLKWAGSAFVNSPPPSALPIPNFLLKKSEGTTLSSTLPEPEAEFINTAAKSLRRILRLTT